MVIALESLFEGGIENIDVDESFDFSAEEYNGVCPFRSDVRLRGKLTNRAGIVSIEAVAEFDFSMPCDRCAADVDRHLLVDVRHVLVQHAEDEDDDLIVVPDMMLDITSLTLEDIYLSLPMKFLCREDCKGICPRCGANLNETSCDCKKEIDPRLEALLSFMGD